MMCVHHVQIDESKFGKNKKVKGHHGKPVEGQWVFGMVEAILQEDGSFRIGKVIAVAVDKRDRRTLIPLIKRHILPGTHIISDGYSTYKCLARLSGCNYTHGVVNHSETFRNEDGETTNMIEGSWKWMKRRIPLQAYNSSAMHDHLFEYIWRHNNKDRVFWSLLECLAQINYSADDGWYFD